jgi:hypothetical protein
MFIYFKIKMEIGDNVKFEDHFSTMYGIIVSKLVPKCKCKGLGKWVIDFNGEIRQVKIGDIRLSPHNIEPSKSSLVFNFK